MEEYYDWWDALFEPTFDSWSWEDRNYAQWAFANEEEEE